MAILFGVDSLYKFFVSKPDSKDGLQDLSGVTDSPSVYIFDSKPTRADAAAGTGAIQTISAWSNTTTPNALGKEFTITALTDPAPTSETERYDYWIAINYVLVDSGAAQLELRRLGVMRAEAVTAPVTVDTDDLEAIFHTIDDYHSTASQDNAIATAIAITKLQLESKGFMWAQIWEPDDLNLSIAYRASSILQINLSRSAGDEWKERHDQYLDISNDLLGNIKMMYDANKDGDPTEKVTQPKFVRFMR